MSDPDRPSSLPSRSKCDHRWSNFLISGLILFLVIYVTLSGLGIVGGK